jgi:hypothetical protein
MKGDFMFIIRAYSPRAQTIALALAVLLIASVATAAKPSKCPAGGISTGRDCHIPVTTIISDVDVNGLPADVRSDGLGPYPHNGNGVSSFLTDNGYNRVDWDWQFDAYASTFRFVNHSFDPEDAVQPGDSHYTAPANPPFWGTQPLTSRITVKCTLLSHNMLTMTAGSSFTCPLINKFNVGGLDYHLSPARSFTGFTDTTDAQVRCNTADSAGCNDWSITPIAFGQAVGRLVPASDTSINDGDFYMRFHIHITRP